MMPVPVTKQQKSKKKNKLRHVEYYGLQKNFDELYEKSKSGFIFTNLMDLIASEENIKLAYRNIKNNKGSSTAGVDGLTVKDIREISEKDYIETVKKKMSWYKSKAVRRVEIPKANGKLRPLGIPTIWDRIVQQCILQVLEPICEAKFYKYSFGFRPNRSAENAVAESYRMIQLCKLHFVVDIDIEGFFDNVNHTKLKRQLWHLGIRDKKLLCIISEMLKAPIVLPNGEKTYPTKGTPQGGILSPLLSNIVLNELDWWISSQWDTHPVHTEFKTRYNKSGSVIRSEKFRALKTSGLKEMRIVRYADDFKIFCRKRSDANKAFIAIKQWLSDRLKLKVNEEKSKVVNLKKSYSEFLGIKVKAIKKRDTYVVRSHVCDKSIKRITQNLIDQIKIIQNPKGQKEEWQSVSKYNSMVMGIQNYYQMATLISLDARKIARNVNTVMKNRLKDKLTVKGNIINRKYIRQRYGNSKQMRLINNFPIVPIGYVQHEVAKSTKRITNQYTAEGRKEIHKNLGVDLSIMHRLMNIKNAYGSIEYLDNRISLYAAQNGKCAITGKVLEIDEIHCHHKQPRYIGGTDSYQNLVILHADVHTLVHAKQNETVQKYVRKLILNKSQLEKVNKLRKKAQLEPI